MITLNDCISLLILQSVQLLFPSFTSRSTSLSIRKKLADFKKFFVIPTIKIFNYYFYQNSQLLFKITIISSEFNSSITFAVRPSYSIPSPQLSPIPLKFPISFDPARNNSPARANERKKERRKRCEKKNCSTPP